MTHHPICTPPTQKEPARSLAAPAGSESGACASREHRNAQAWREIAYFLCAQASGLEFKGAARGIDLPMSGNSYQVVA